MNRQVAHIQTNAVTEAGLQKDGWTVDGQTMSKTMSGTLTTLTKKFWSNVGQSLVNRPTFDYALFGEHLTKVLVISWSQVSQKLVT